MENQIITLYRRETETLAETKFEMQIQAINRLFGYRKNLRPTIRSSQRGQVQRTRPLELSTVSGISKLSAKAKKPKF